MPRIGVCLPPFSVSLVTKWSTRSRSAVLRICNVAPVRGPSTACNSTPSPPITAVKHTAHGPVLALMSNITRVTLVYKEGTRSIFAPL